MQGSPAASASEEALQCIAAWAGWTAHHEGIALRLRPDEILAADQEESQAMSAVEPHAAGAAAGRISKGGAGHPPRLESLLSCIAARSDMVSMAAAEACLCLAQQPPTECPALVTVLAAPGRGEKARQAVRMQVAAARRSAMASRGMALGLARLEGPWGVWSGVGTGT